jgi:hypothetical protein
MPNLSLLATIAAGQSLSGAVDFGNNYVVGLIMPTAWTNAHCSVLVSLNNTNYFDLFSFDDLGGSTNPTEFKFNVVSGAIVAVDPDRLLMGRYIKFRSGTREQPVLQAAARVFTVITRSAVTVQQLAEIEGGP